MFDISTISKRYFEIKLTVTDNEEKVHNATLEVEPPKVKALKKLFAISKAAKEDAMDELSEAVRKLLSKNKSHYDVPMEYIDDLNFDQLQEILRSYFNWVSEKKNSPN